jgi:hypothetical protein
MRGGRFMMGAGLVRHHGLTRAGGAMAGMIATRRLNCSHCEVERTDSGYDSYKTAHAGLVLSVRLQPM